MKFSRRSVMRLAGLVGTGAAFNFDSLTSARAAAPVKVTLPWLPMGTFSYAFVAKKMGFWEKRGLDVTIDRGFGSGKVCVPVDQGQYDFGILDLGVMMNCAGRGLNLTAIAGIWPRSPVGIFSLKEKDLKDPKQLEGKRVAFDAGSADFQLWPAFVKANGIEDQKVNKIMMDGDSIIKAMVDKQVDAVGNFYGDIAPALWSLGLDFNVLLYDDFGVKLYSNVLACKNSMIEKRPELCESFVTGLMEGLRYVYLNPERSVDIHLESVKELQGGTVSNKKVVEYGQAVSTGLGMVPSFKDKGLGYMDPASIAATADTVTKYMGVRGMPELSQLYSNKFVGSVKLSDQEWSDVSGRSEKYVPRHL